MLHPLFHHTVLPFRRVPVGPWARVPVGPWAIICLDCCTLTYNPHMEKGVAKVSEVHHGEVRVFSPMELSVVTPTVLR